MNTLLFLFDDFSDIKLYVDCESQHHNQEIPLSVISLLHSCPLIKSHSVI